MAETWQEKQEALKAFLAMRAAEEGAAPTPMGPIPQGALVPLLVKEATRRRGIPNWSEDNPDTPSLYPTDEWARQRYWANQQVTPTIPTQTQTTTPTITTPAATTPADATQGLISGMSLDEQAGISVGGLRALTTRDAEFNNIAKRFEDEAKAGSELTRLDMAKIVSGEEGDGSPKELIGRLNETAEASWTARDAGLESTETRRKQYMKDMNDIFTKSMMLKVLSNLSGGDGGDMSKMFMQFAFEKMDKRKEFAGEDRLKKIRDAVYYREGPGGEMIFDAPEFRSDGYKRVIAVNGTAKDAEAMFGHLPIRKQPSTTKANYTVWHRIVDGKLQQDSFRGDELPDRGEHPNIPWLAMSYTAPTKRAGTEYMQFLAKASALLQAGDRDGAQKQMRIFFRGEQKWLEKQVTPERLEELVQETMADLGAGSGGVGQPRTRAEAKVILKQDNPGKSDAALEAMLDHMGYSR